MNLGNSTLGPALNLAIPVHANLFKEGKTPAKSNHALGLSLSFAWLTWLVY